MKETNYQTIHDEVMAQLLMTEWSITDYLGLDQAIQIVFNIYLTNDVLQGFGQDVKGVISVISSRYRISVIADGSSSWYQEREGICIYDNLDEDVNRILIALQAAITRMQFNQFG